MILGYEAFLDITPKTCKKPDTLECIKIFKIYTPKGIIKRVKRQPKMGGNICKSSLIMNHIKEYMTTTITQHLKKITQEAHEKILNIISH